MKILGNPISKAIIDVQWAFISIVIASLAHFVLRIILGKEFGAEWLGVYTLAFTFYLLGLQFSAFGIQDALTKYVAEFIKDQGLIKTYVSSGMTSSVITGTAMGIVLFLFAPYLAISFFHIPELEILIQLTALSYPFIAVQKAVLGTLNGFRRMHIFAFLNIVQNLAIVVTTVALVLIFRLGVLGAIIGFVAPTIIISLFSIILIRDSLVFNLCSLWHRPALQSTTIFGFYIVLAQSIAFLNAQIGNILIGFYLNATEVGIYAVAVLFAQIVILIPSAVQRVTAPVIATLYGKGDFEGIKKIVLSAMKKCFIISLIISIFIVVFGKIIIAGLFTAEFIQSYQPLVILLIGYVFLAPVLAIGSTFSSINKVHIIFRIALVCGIVNIILAIFLIPFLGISGVALSTTVVNILCFGINLKLLQNFIFKRDSDYF